MFLIREGTCDVIVKKPDGGSVKVAERGRATSSARWRFRCAGFRGEGETRTASVWPPREDRDVPTKSDMVGGGPRLPQNQIDEVIAARTASSPDQVILIMGR